MTLKQSSSQMESLYADNNLDPWGNIERAFYSSGVLSNLVKDADSRFDRHIPLVWHDIGCGTGEVLKGVIKHLTEIGSESRYRYSGVDISPTALQSVRQNIAGTFSYRDLEASSSEPCEWAQADIVSLIEVLYYFRSDKRTWKESFEYITSSTKAGALLIVADSIIPYQYRDHLKKDPRWELVSSFTEYDHPVSKKNASGAITRYLKSRSYRKL